MPDGDPPCCGGTRDDSNGARIRNRDDAPVSDLDTSRMVRLGGDSFLMGTDDIGFEDDGEGPVREVALEEFYVGQHAVTNAEFYRFVSDTEYTTDAERYGWSFIFEGHLTDGGRQHTFDAAGPAPWWMAVEGACWYRPFGPESGIEDRLDHPVVHVSWNDAVAYCKWAGTRLPTEAEWEYAARGGLSQRRFPWGDELTPAGEHYCNIWQGEFPDHNTASDGYDHTAPVDAFEANGYGLYNTAGNVWEWTADWWTTNHEEGLLKDPSGPDNGAAKVIRGGSHLCHRSYCNRYRVAARTQNTPDSTTSHIGFRIAGDP